MKRVDLAQYFFSEHKLHPIFCGSRDYPPVFLEYMEYGTFEFIPWLLAEGYVQCNVCMYSVHTCTYIHVHACVSWQAAYSFAIVSVVPNLVPDMYVHVFIYSQPYSQLNFNWASLL